MKKNILASVFAVVASGFVINAAETRKWTIGTELDLVPYLNEGYYTSAIAGYDHFRARLVWTGITTPDFVTQEGFTDNDLSVRAYIMDYYFLPGFKGWWVGPGIEEWNGDVTEEGSDERNSYRTIILTLGGGYTFRFGKHIYLNPWAAVHLPVGGDREVQFKNSTFSIDPEFEGSIKLGINY